MGELFKDIYPLLKEKLYFSIVFDLDYWVATVAAPVARSINVFHQSLLSSELGKQLVNYSEQLASLVKLTRLQEGLNKKSRKKNIQSVRLHISGLIRLSIFQESK